jgi:hypothetical protein
MSVGSPAGRVRGRFMSFSLWTSALIFLIVEGYLLADQLQIGHATAIFMLGTACLVASFCIGFFALISAIGLTASIFFSEELPPEQPRGRASGANPVDRHNNPHTYIANKPKQDVRRRSTPLGAWDAALHHNQRDLRVRRSQNIDKE